MARNRTIVLTAVAVIVVIVVVALASITALEANRSKEVELIGTCNSTDYLLPDSLSSSVTNITTISNRTTTVYASTSIISPTTETITSSYTTFLVTNISTHFTTTNTSTLYPYSPVPETVVATCTFAPLTS